MAYVVLCVIIVVLVFALIVVSFIIGSGLAERDKSIAALESSTKKWMDSADWFRKLSEDHVLKLQESYDKLLVFDDTLDKTKKELSKERSRNKSVEVRTGLIMEKMAPFFEGFDHDPKNAQFLGKPIDYIIFNDDEIVFLEVKTGKARATKKQAHIKKLIEDKKVRFELVRFDYE